MFEKIISTFDNIVNSGVEKAETDNIGKRVLLANQISLVAVTLGFPVTVLYLFVIKEYPILISGAPLAIFFIAIPWLNKLGYINFTRIGMCLSFTIGSFVLPFVSKLHYMHDAIGINMYYVPRMIMLLALCLPMLLIDMRERVFMFFTVGLTLVLLLSYDMVDTWLGTAIGEVDIHYRFYPNLNFYMLIAALFLISVFYYLRRANRQYEMEITNLNRSLDKRVRQKTAELQEVNKDLKAFSYTVSHELKTALMGAKLMAQSIKTAKPENEVDAQETQKLNTLDSCLNEMQHLLSDIMAYSQVGLQVTESETLDMNSIFREVIDEYPNKELSKAVEWKLQDVPEISGDRKMIKLVATNLISNAIKFTKDEENPIIEVSGKRDAGFVIFQVKDNGIGFDMRDKEKLFDIFERLHSKSKYEGTGLGLAIAKRIIEKHGGEIWAEGKAGEGACFCFKLPKDLKE